MIGCRYCGIDMEHEPKGRSDCGHCRQLRRALVGAQLLINDIGLKSEALQLQAFRSVSQWIDETADE